MQILQAKRERTLPAGDFETEQYTGEICASVDTVPAMSGVSSREGSLYQQRLSHFLHETESQTGSD